jgi:hypothetical protein
VSPFIINGDAPLYVCLPLPIIGDTLNQMCLALGSPNPKSLCNRVLFWFSSNRWRYFLLRQPSFTVLTTAPQAFLDPSAPQELLDPSAPQAHIAAAKAHTTAVIHPSWSCLTPQQPGLLVRLPVPPRMLSTPPSLLPDLPDARHLVRAIRSGVICS